jgi:predicted branched-subunit amino acid permease
VRTLASEPRHVTEPDNPNRNTPAAPAWAATATPGVAFVRGLGAAFEIPGLVLLAGSIGFGALSRDMGLDVGFGIWTSIIFYALPAQVVLADQLGRGASLLAAAFAVTLTAVRLLPMTVTLSPYLKDPKSRRIREIAAVHFIAVTAWIEGHRRLGPLPDDLKLPHFFGFGLCFLIMTVTGSVIGWAMAGSVPHAVSAALLFFTPTYFLLSMIATAQANADRLAIILGVAIGPVVYRISPDLDLLVAGLVGGTVAYMVGRRR